MLDINAISCSFCHKAVSPFDAVFNDGLPFHEHCYRFSLSRELESLDKKTQLGKITLAENNMRSDIQYQLDLARTPIKVKEHNKKDPYRFCQKPGFGFMESSNVRYFPGPEGHGVCGDFIKLPAARIRSSRSYQKQNMRLLEGARSERWAWEFFNKIEDNKLLSESNDKLPTFPLENHLFLEEKN